MRKPEFEEGTAAGFLGLPPHQNPYHGRQDSAGVEMRSDWLSGWTKGRSCKEHGIDPGRGDWLVAIADYRSRVHQEGYTALARDRDHAARF